MALTNHTYQDIIALGPCFDPAERGYCTRDWTGTALDVLRHPDVPAEEKLWLVFRPSWLPDRLMHESAVWCAEQALALVEAPDPRSVEAISSKRRWLRGEATNDELLAARDAARAAARAAAWAAARAAARAAAWDAARAAAWEAARAAAQAAAWAAAEDAAVAAWDAAAAAAVAAAWDAARAAAGDAAQAAAWAAARGAARAAQVSRLIEMIEAASA